MQKIKIHQQHSASKAYLSNGDLKPVWLYFQDENGKRVGQYPEAFKKFYRQIHEVEVVRPGPEQLLSALKSFCHELPNDSSEITFATFTLDQDMFAFASTADVVGGYIRKGKIHFLPQDGAKVSSNISIKTAQLQVGDTIFIGSTKLSEQLRSSKLAKLSRESTQWQRLSAQLESASSADSLWFAADICAVKNKVQPDFLRLKTRRKKVSPKQRHQFRPSSVPPFAVMGRWALAAMFTLLLALLVGFGLANIPVQETKLASADTLSKLAQPPVAIPEKEEIASSPVTIKAGTKLWEFIAPAKISSSPTIWQNVVYVGCKDSYLYAIALQSGKMLWKAKTGGGIGSSPVVDQKNGSVIIGSYDGYLYSFDLQSGKELWKFGTKRKIISSPQIHGATIYFGSFDQHIYALQAATGSLKWKRQTVGQIWSSPASDGARVYVGSFDKKVYGLSVTDGKILWQISTPDQIYSSPVVADGGIVVFGGKDKKVYAIDAASGEKVWQTAVKDMIYGSPAFRGDKIYIGTNGGTMLALNLGTGHKVWETVTYGKKEIRSRPCLTDEAIYVSSYDHHLYAFDPESGSILWQYDAGASMYASPTAADDRVVIATLAGKVIAIQAENGLVL